MNALSRRGFLRAASVAPVAAGHVVKSTAQALGVASMADVASMGVTLADGLNNVTDKSWMRSEIEDLLKESKRLSERKDEDTIKAQAVCANVDALVSVSPTSRIRIASDEIDERRRASHLSYIDRRIAELKEKLGILGDIL